MLLPQGSGTGTFHKLQQLLYHDAKVPTYVNDFIVVKQATANRTIIRCGIDYLVQITVKFTLI